MEATPFWVCLWSASRDLWFPSYLTRRRLKLLAAACASDDCQSRESILTIVRSSKKFPIWYLRRFYQTNNSNSSENVRH